MEKRHRRAPRKPDCQTQAERNLTTWNSVQVFSASLLRNDSIKAPTSKDSGDFYNNHAHKLPSEQITEYQTALLCPAMLCYRRRSLLSLSFFLCVPRKHHAYSQIKWCVKWDENVSCFLSSISVRCAVGLPVPQPTQPPAFSHRIADNLQFQATTKGKNSNPPQIC